MQTANQRVATFALNIVTALSFLMIIGTSVLAMFDFANGIYSLDLALLVLASTGIVLVLTFVASTCLD